MGKTKETVSLRLMGSQHDKMNEYDEYLYTVLESAAGSDSTLNMDIKQVGFHKYITVIS